MEKAKMKVIHFEVEDVIATSCGNLGSNFTGYSLKAMNGNTVTYTDTNGNIKSIFAADSSNTLDNQVITGNPTSQPFTTDNWYHVDKTSFNSNEYGYTNWVTCTDESHHKQ